MLKEDILENYGYLNRLANTFMHKFNSALRKKYRQVTVAYGEAMTGLSSEEDFEEEFMRSQEASKLRRDLLWLSKTLETILPVACYMCYHLYAKA